MFVGAIPEPILIEIEVDTTYMLPDNEGQTIKTEVEKHRENIRTILLSTNATPIGRYGSLGYSCCFCTEQYLDPTELKKHTLDYHDEESISNFMNNYTLLNYIVKLDITGLRCDICMSPISELYEIIEHLMMEHEKNFHTDIGSHIVPFRFEAETLQCVDCSYEFNNFKILLEHMNTHYSNHVCEVCEAGFVNKRMLQAHMYRHKIGVFNCSYCSKVFDTRVKTKVHERMVHMYVKKRPKCSVCEKKFADFDKMIQHEAITHGLKRDFKCKICNKLFTTQKSFEIHNEFYCGTVS